MNIRRTETRGADKEKKLCGGSRECRAEKTAGWKKGKICEAACILWAVLLLSGCQLAREETGSQGADKLCGVLITTQNQVDAWRASQKAGPEDSAESVELTQGQMKQLLNGETEIFLDSREISGGWQVEGIPGEDGEYVFQGLEGASLMAGCTRRMKTAVIPITRQTACSRIFTITPIPLTREKPAALREPFTWGRRRM